MELYHDILKAILDELVENDNDNKIIKNYPIVWMEIKDFIAKILKYISETRLESDINTLSV